MTYTINGKEYTEFDINKRCAEILYPDSEVVRSIVGENMVTVEGMGFAKIMISYCNNPFDTWPIIERCWDELMTWIDYNGNDTPYSMDYPRISKWEFLMQDHDCTKLIAACICFIEVNNDNN